jgi:hypothetical protein
MDTGLKFDIDVEIVSGEALIHLSGLLDNSLYFRLRRNTWNQLHPELQQLISKFSISQDFSASLTNVCILW